LSGFKFLVGDPTVAEIVSKIFAVYDTRKFITVVTKVHYPGPC